MPADELENPFPIAPASTRLGLLQRGRGAGFVMALRHGAQAHQALRHCVLHDPRVDRELDALGRLADERSAPLLVEVAEQATYSHARRRAVYALAAMPDLPVAQQVLREALWDSEDETVADTCAFVPQLDAEARLWVAAMARHPLVAAELAERAARRLRRS